MCRPLLSFWGVELVAKGEIFFIFFDNSIEISKSGPQQRKKNNMKKKKKKKKIKKKQTKKKKKNPGQKLFSFLFFFLFSFSFFLSFCFFFFLLLASLHTLPAAAPPTTERLSIDWLGRIGFLFEKRVLNLPCLPSLLFFFIFYALPSLFFFVSLEILSPSLSLSLIVRFFFFFFFLFFLFFFFLLCVPRLSLF
jgi:hypothetical protein